MNHKNQNCEPQESAGSIKLTVLSTRGERHSFTELSPEEHCDVLWKPPQSIKILLNSTLFTEKFRCMEF